MYFQHGGIEFRGDGVHYFLHQRFLEGSFKYSKANGMGTLYTKHGDISATWVIGYLESVLEVVIKYCPDSNMALTNTKASGKRTCTMVKV